VARMSRLKYSDPRNGYYHLISRTVLKSFLLDDESREMFLRILRMLTRVYFVKVVTFSLMSNHFHLIVRMLPSNEISDEELKERFNIYYNEGKLQRNWRPYHPENRERYRQRYADLSRFMQDLKQRFSRWYNKKTNNEGHVWSDRFRSVMLEDGRALLACMVYVELNSIRAGLVERPEDFRYCGISHLVTGGRIAAWLDHETLTRLLNPSSLIALFGKLPLNATEEDTLQQKTKRTSQSSNIKQYLALVYKEGMIEVAGKNQIQKSIGEYAQKTHFVDVGVFSLRRRWRHFSAGLFIGSKDFCIQCFNEFRTFFKTDTVRQPYRLASQKQVSSDSMLNLFVMRKLH